MREMDFTEKNLFNRLCGVNTIWKQIQGEVTQKDLAMTCGTGLRFIIDLEKGKPTCQIGKTLQVLQALGLKFQIASPGADTGKARSHE